MVDGGLWFSVGIEATAHSVVNGAKGNVDERSTFDGEGLRKWGEIWLNGVG